MFRAFMACTGAVGQLLSGYGVHHDSGQVNYMTAATLDPELMNLMLIAAKLRKEATGAGRKWGQRARLHT